MRAVISGTVVKVEQNEPWTMNGRSGLYHGYYVRDADDVTASAQRVRVPDPAATPLPVEGDVVEAFVNVRAQNSDFGPAKLKVTHLAFSVINGEQIPTGELSDIFA